MSKSTYFMCVIDRHPRWNIGWRVLLATAGGYGVAWLAAASLAIGLPMAKVNAVATAIMLAFVVQALVAIWVFAAATVMRATVGVVLSAAFFGLWQWWQQGVTV